MILRPYQSDCIQSALDGLRSHRAVVAILATGLGKTVIGAKLLVEWAHRGLGGRILWLAHREELIEQAAAAIRQITGLNVSVEMGENWADEYGFAPSPIVIASVATLARWRRRKRFRPCDFGLIVTDEAHHSLAASYRTIYDYFIKGDPEEKIEGNAELRLFGLTATPKRSDDLALGRVYDAVSYEYGIAKAVRDGYLVPVRQATAIVNHLDLSEVKITKGDFSASQLESLLTDPNKKIVLQMAGPIAEHAADKPAIVFTAGKNQARQMANALNARRPAQAAFVTDETPKEERRRIIKDFKEGRLQFFCNCGIATEGFDAVAVALVAVARPTKSLALYTQMLGRATRPLRGVVDGIDDVATRHSAIALSAKPFATVLDFVGNVQRHGEQATINAADVLGGDYSADVRAYAKRGLQQSGSRPVEDALLRADAELALMREEEERLAALVADVGYRIDYLHDPARGPDREHNAGRRGEPATSRQVLKLGSLGIPRYKAERCTKAQARGWIGRLLAERVVTP